MDNEPVERVCPKGGHGHDDHLGQKLDKCVAVSAVFYERAEECAEPGVENDGAHDHNRIQNRREQRVCVGFEGYLPVHDIGYRVADDCRDEVRIHIALIFDSEKRQNGAVRHGNIVQRLEHNILEQGEHAELYQRRGRARKSELYKFPYLRVLFEKASVLFGGSGFFHLLIDRARAFLSFVPGFPLLPISLPRRETVHQPSFGKAKVKSV